MFKIDWKLWRMFRELTTIEQIIAGIMLFLVTCLFFSCNRIVNAVQHARIEKQQVLMSAQFAVGEVATLKVSQSASMILEIKYDYDSKSVMYRIRSVVPFSTTETRTKTVMKVGPHMDFNGNLTTGVYPGTESYEVDVMLSEFLVHEFELEKAQEIR